MDDLTVAAADVGSISKGNFGWATCVSKLQRTGTDIEEFVGVVADALGCGPVALGFECPLFVPFRSDVGRLTSQRDGEDGSPWSAGAGSAVLCTGLGQVPYILDRLRKAVPTAQAHLKWDDFVAEGNGLFLWEAFVTKESKRQVDPSRNPHEEDALLAVEAFRNALQNPQEKNAISEPDVLSLLGAAMLRVNGGAKRDHRGGVKWDHLGAAGLSP